MEKMSRTAKVLDQIIAVVYALMLLCTVLGILMLVMMVFLALTDSPILAMMDTSLDLGHVTLVLADGAEPVLSRWYWLALTVFSCLSLPVYCIILLTIRDILKPFIARQPFHGTVAKDLHRLAILVTVNTVLDWIGSGILAHLARISNVEQLLLSDAIRSVTLKFDHDLTPLLFAAALYLLSKVFLYGQELQQLSDETL